MAGEERKLCLFCIERGACEGKYHMPGGEASYCREYRRDASLKPADRSKRNVLIVGPAGAERTKLVEAIMDRTGLASSGYYTKVVQEGFLRSRVDLVLLSEGETRVLPAAAGGTADVWLMPTIEQALRSDDRGLLVLDEVGTLQGASVPFRRVLVDCFTSDRPVLATLSLGGREEDFLLSLESRADVRILPLRDGTQEALAESAVRLLRGEPAPQVELACL